MKKLNNEFHNKSRHITAIFNYYNDTNETLEIPIEFIDDIASAVQGQYLYANNDIIVYGYNIKNIEFLMGENKKMIAYNIELIRDNTHILKENKKLKENEQTNGRKNKNLS